MRSSKCGQRARNFALSSASVFTLPQHNADKYSWVSNYDDILIYLQRLSNNELGIELAKGKSCEEDCGC